MSLYDDLGIKPNAKPPAVRKAYIKKAKKAHPDAGGSAEAFKKIKEAYDVLSNPERRERYDRDGTTDEPRDLRTARAMEMIGASFDATIKRGDMQIDWARTTDIVAVMKSGLKAIHDKCKEQLTEADRILEMLREMFVRLETRPERDVVGETIAGRIKGLQMQREKIALDFDASVSALAMLEGYIYRLDPKAKKAEQRMWPLGNTGRIFLDLGRIEDDDERS